ncbi:MAG: heme-binding domain-containing protein [Marinifilaceae bacterium]
MKSIKSKIKLIVLICIGIFVVVTIIKQFLPVVTHPPVTETVTVPQEVLSILKRSCFDCHSNETRITWIQRLPIVSAMVRSDVKQARQIINFSEWNTYSSSKQTELLVAALVAINNNEMPPSNYLFIHKDAKITTQDKEILNNYISKLIAR